MALIMLMDFPLFHRPVVFMEFIERKWQSLQTKTSVGPVLWNKSQLKLRKLPLCSSKIKIFHRFSERRVVLKWKTATSLMVWPTLRKSSFLLLHIECADRFCLSFWHYFVLSVEGREGGRRKETRTNLKNNNKLDISKQVVYHFIH